jgi:ribonuclease HIII
MVRQNSYSFKLDKAQQASLIGHLRSGNYEPRSVPYTIIAVAKPKVQIALYTSGKCVVQGKESEDWVKFVLEPQVLKQIMTGYDEVLTPEMLEPHMGIDESGKGDFFGPLVIASAYVDNSIVKDLKSIGVRDSKNISSDLKIATIARELRKLLKDRFALVTVGPSAYNRLYKSMGNLNKLLAWGHARAIENLLEKVPNCPKAISDQFGPERQIKAALMKNGRSIELIQRTKAESDPAVAAASILARAQFLYSLNEIQKKYDMEIFKGASAKVRAAAAELVGKRGPAVLNDVAKVHFKTAAEVLRECGHSLKDLETES